MSKKGLKGVGAVVHTLMGEGGTVVLVALTVLSSLAVSRAHASPRSGPSASQAIPFQWSGRAPSPWPCWIKPFPTAGAVGSAPVRMTPYVPVSPARLRYLKRQERLVRQKMWRLRLRRRTFLAEGRPQHAHKVTQHILNLGWRLRRIQAAERAGRND